MLLKQNIHEELQKQLFQQLTKLMEIENDKFLKQDRIKIPTAVVITGKSLYQVLLILI